MTLLFKRRRGEGCRVEESFCLVKFPEEKLNFQQVVESYRREERMSLVLPFSATRQREKTGMKIKIEDNRRALEPKCAEIV